MIRLDADQSDQGPLADTAGEAGKARRTAFRHRQNIAAALRQGRGSSAGALIERGNKAGLCPDLLELFLLQSAHKLSPSVEVLAEPTVFLVPHLQLTTNG